MPICSHCGEANAEHTVRCTKCGIGLGHQMRAQASADRNRTLVFVKIGVWVAVIVVAFFVGPGLYRSALGSYLKFHLESINANTVKSCGGPVTETTPLYQATEYQKCMASNEDLLKAQQDWDDFNKPTK